MSVHRFRIEKYKADYIDTSMRNQLVGFSPLPFSPFYPFNVADVVKNAAIFLDPRSPCGRPRLVTPLWYA